MPGNTLPTLPNTGLAARRRKIAKACDFCREHRVRCEAITPCPQCVANRVTCRRSRLPNKTRKSSLVRRHVAADQQTPDRPPIENTTTTASQPEEAFVPTPSPSANLAWTSQKTDSILGFIARINDFCSSVAPSSLNTIPSGDGPHLDQTSPFPPPSIPQASYQAECNLSPHQTRHLMKIFWTRLRPRMPIVQWEDLTPSSEEVHGAPSPLQDAIKAYSLHSIYCSGLHNRIVGLNWPQFERQKSSVGMPYFQRSLAAVTQFATFAVPSLSDMQCYCYLTLFLLEEGHHKAAYNMIGLGLRIAQSLNYMDARHSGYRECQLFRRVWWTLIHLDFRCSKHVGKPVSGNLDELMCLVPGREPEDVHLSNGLLFHTESIRLTAAALAVNDLMHRRSCSLSSGAAGTTEIESRAEALSDFLFKLRNWRDELPQAKDFEKMHFDVPDLPSAPKGAAIVENEDTEQSPIITLLSTSLLLQYHNVMVGLHRVFIQFPSHPLIPKSTPRAAAHAATALNHALTMIQISHNVMATQDFLHGLSELYQYLWNAVITIIGFMLAYPYCHRCSVAREYLYLALEIFDSAGKENFTATRAATLTRHLCAKVQSLVQVLNFNHLTPATSSSPAPITETHVLQSHTNDAAYSASHNDDDVSPDLNTDFLGPWTDLINLDAWPDYCLDVNEAFMDPEEFLAPHNL
ncbi:hypothetical protein F1880_006677 [Penicillium rolfsii]|nr:hypothetical protein F1880_006677 [Penicillium rolfsii]